MDLISELESRWDHEKCCYAEVRNTTDTDALELAIYRDLMHHFRKVEGMMRSIQRKHQAETKGN